tara:strand:+ start:2237 stop:2518 length:282 start_codon:yes stop_codon:yes gene_type:complete
MKVNFDREEQELVLVALNNLEEHYRTVCDKEGNYYWLQQISKLIALKKKIVWSADETNEEYVNRVDFEYNTEDKYYKGVTSWNERDSDCGEDY